MSVREIPEITRGNDLTVRVGPIRGRDTDDVIKDWNGAQISAFIVQDETSDTPLGGVTITANVITNAKFVASFDAAEITTILAAAVSLVDGSRMWCIIVGAGDLRVAAQLVYRTARRV